VHWWLKAVDIKKVDVVMAEALNSVGLAYKQCIGGLQQDYEQAEIYWRSAIELGDVTAQFNFAMLIYERFAANEAVDGDEFRMVDLWKGVAQDKNATVFSVFAMHNLGAVYEKGFHRVKKYVEQAKAWYGRAAAAGDDDAEQILTELDAPVQLRPAASAPCTAASCAKAIGEAGIFRIDERSAAIDQFMCANVRVQ
jgi:TPR repeat protein